MKHLGKTMWRNPMKIAIPLFGSRVSPRFGCEPEILIVDIEEH